MAGRHREVLCPLSGRDLHKKRLCRQFVSKRGFPGKDRLNEDDCVLKWNEPQLSLSKLATELRKQKTFAAERILSPREVAPRNSRIRGDNQKQQKHCWEERSQRT